MADNKIPLLNNTTNLADSFSGLPLLNKDQIVDDGRGRTPTSPAHGRSPSDGSDTVNNNTFTTTATPPTRPPLFTRRSQMRSRSPDAQARIAARKKYTLAGIFLLITLFSFVLQTELGRYVQHDLGWDKAYCMLYLTHGSWVVLWPTQLAILRFQKQNRNIPWGTFWRRHHYILRSTAHMVAEQELDIPRHVLAANPAPYILKATAFITATLTIAGLSWYVAVNMTSPSDLTAIYNCSTFFAYAFSVPLLKEKLRLDKSLAVLLAIVGVLVVAYGDAKESEGTPAEAGTQLLGNLIIGAGSVLYGLYEVLYKRFGCPPEGTSPSRGVIFANTFASCIGAFTLLVLWIPLPILHVLGWETFELPGGKAALYLFLSVLLNATFAGSFLVMISLTSPVLSSVAALLTIFIVAVADWLITGKALTFAALLGGAMIIVAFLLLSWSTWREMTEDAKWHPSHGADAGYTEANVVDWDSEDDVEGSDKDDGR
ncbi:hypothetical protein F5Y16DRAFT_386294 [Xylariaceae sp. FL0255]|nr:hypothetical protein F5Y16DRAFT_386294 [Xylariaceae sp. FL0255]